MRLAVLHGSTHFNYHGERFLWSIGGVKFHSHSNPLHHPKQPQSGIKSAEQWTKFLKNSFRLMSSFVSLPCIFSLRLLQHFGLISRAKNHFKVATFWLLQGAFHKRGRTSITLTWKCSLIWEEICGSLNYEFIQRSALNKQFFLFVVKFVSRYLCTKL